MEDQETTLYRPLETSTSIRILSISGEDDDIHVQLTHCELSDIAKDYVAISYVWGSSETPNQITVNGKPFWVTNSALHNLRKAREWTPEVNRFWMDAICINQSDLDEKSTQIPLMRRIYEDSYAIFAFLIPTTTCSLTANEKTTLLEQFSKDFREQTRQTNGEDLVTFDTLGADSRYLQDDFRSEVLELLEHHWFKRVWILQEATTKNHTFIFYGDWIIRSNPYLARLYEYQILMRSQEPSIEPQAIVEPPLLNMLALQRRRKTTDTFDTLLGTLRLFQGFEATEPRDFVFAAMTFASDLSPDQVKVDYKMSVAKVYAQVAHNVSHTLSPLAFLRDCGTTEVELHVPDGWASWVPDWQQKRSTSAYLPRQDSTWPESSLPTIGQDRDTFIRFDSLHMHARGISLGKIEMVTTPITWADSISESILEVVHHVQQWTPTEPTELYTDGSCSRLEAFLATIASARVRKEALTKGVAPQMPLYYANVPEAPPVALPTNEMAMDHMFLVYRQFATTSNGYFALVKHQAEVGDLLVALAGGGLYTLRWKEDRQAYWFTGDCYVHGLMEGQVSRYADGKPDALEWFDIV